MYAIAKLILPYICASHFTPYAVTLHPDGVPFYPVMGLFLVLWYHKKMTTQQANYLTFYALKQVHQCNTLKNLLQTVKFTFKIRKMLNRTYFVPLLPGLLFFARRMLYDFICSFTWSWHGVYIIHEGKLTSVLHFDITIRPKEFMGH